MTSQTALVVGEALIDVVVDERGVSSEHVGGSPANVAIGLGRLERATLLVTSFADDPRGQLIADRLAASGVTTLAASPTGVPTSVAIATLGAHAVASYEFDITWDPGTVTIPTVPLIVHTGSLGAYLAPGCDRVDDILNAHAATSTITLDPNIRPSLMDRDRALTRVHRLLALADVVKVSDEDLDWLHPGVDPATIAADWLDKGARLVVLTQGARGARAWTSEVTARVQSRPVALADTVGAGDAFMSGLIDGLWQADLLGAHRREALAGVDASDLTSLLEFANHSAALCVTRVGAEPPTRSALGSWCG